MKVKATNAFLAFARPAAATCIKEKGEILFLSYTHVETKFSKGLRWVLNVVAQPDFPGNPVMQVDDLAILYQPEVAEKLQSAVLDFRDRKIIIDSLPRCT